MVVMRNPIHKSMQAWLTPRADQLIRTIRVLATRLFFASLFAICGQASTLASTTPNPCDTITWHQRADGLSNEYWVFAKAIHGCNVDFFELYPDDKDVGKRTFDANFLRTMLTDRNMRDQLGSLPVRLQNAQITGTLDLADITSNRALSITHSRFDNPPNFERYRSKSSLTLDDDSIESFHPASGKAIQSGEAGPKVNFSFARIGGLLSAKNLHVYYPIDMAHVYVDGPLFLDNASCDATHQPIQNCRITISNAIITEKLSINHAHTRGDIDLGLIQVGDELDLNGIDGPKDIILDNSVIHGKVGIGEGAQVGRINLNEAVIDGDLDIRQSHIGKVSLIGAQIAA